MIKSNYRVIGVMSGTSLDGLDLAFIEFELNNYWSFRIVKAETIEYSEEWREILKTLISLSIENVQEIDEKYTLYLAKEIRGFIERYGINDLDAICSHGHTALHRPESGLTYQIGNLKTISDLVGETVVCDFRVEDVKLGGQGAPLVPIGDHLLFSEYDYCLNLGGFANVSTIINGKRIAYDICPVNIVLNHYVSKKGLYFDDEGKIAASGKISSELLKNLNTLNFYLLKPPKSLGLEWVKEFVFPLIDRHQLCVEDILKTFIEHVAYQIGMQINNKQNSTILITGGGVYNLYLIHRIKDFTTNTIIIPTKNLIEYKEALIFGLLGVLKLRGENNCLQSVTGADKDHSSGYIYYY
jgi:anhydro-N-acetylmuramic acid kinase